LPLSPLSPLSPLLLLVLCFCLVSALDLPDAV